MIYLSLFLAALLAATLVPAQSEALLVALLLDGSHSIALLLLVATTGNTLGSVINWWLGRYIERFRDKRWFPASKTGLARAQQRFQRYGYWSLLLSWVPIIGDPLTIIAGLMRVRFLPFLLLVLIAKGGRYAILVWITLQAIQ